MTSADRDKVKYIKTYQLTGHTHHDGSLMDSNRGRNVGLLVSTTNTFVHHTGTHNMITLADLTVLLGIH
jgi:hypothetical protein